MKVIKGPSAENVTSSYQKEQGKIVLEKCPRNCLKCKSVLAEINRYFYESDKYRHNKEYQLSILSLKKAYKKTFELREPVDKDCGKIFRMIIIDSLNNIHKELVKMTSGFYRKKHYNFSLLMAEKTLKELLTGSSGEFTEVNLQPDILKSGTGSG